MTCKHIIGFLAVDFNRRSTNDLPQLPRRMSEVW
jgi:hypothetical protein